MVLLEIISVNIDRMHLYCCSSNSCSSAHLPSNSSSLLQLDYTVSAATSSCRLVVPKMTPEPSVTVHILGFCYSTFPAPRDMLRHILVFVLRVLLPMASVTSLLGLVLCSLPSAVRGCLALTYQRVCCVFSPNVAAFMNRLMFTCYKATTAMYMRLCSSGTDRLARNVDTPLPLNAA